MDEKVRARTEVILAANNTIQPNVSLMPDILGGEIVETHLSHLIRYELESLVDRHNGFSLHFPLPQR